MPGLVRRLRYRCKVSGFCIRYLSKSNWILWMTMVSVARGGWDNLGVSITRRGSGPKRGWLMGLVPGRRRLSVERPGGCRVSEKPGSESPGWLSECRLVIEYSESFIF